MLCYDATMAMMSLGGGNFSAPLSSYGTAVVYVARHWQEHHIAVCDCTWIELMKHLFILVPHWLLHLNLLAGASSGF